jgi:phage-related holin
MDEYLSFPNLVKGIWELLCGIMGTIIGYFLPIKDMVNFIVLLFLIDVLLGYLSARKLRGEKFSTRIIWRTTMPRMLISVLLIIIAYMWDDVFKQTLLQTYNMVGWFIAGILIFSIAKNGFKITRWQGFLGLENIFRKKIKEETGAEL